MKTRSSHRPNGTTQSQRVRFELVAPRAQTVCIAGTFNDWHPQATPMIDMGQGRWAKELMLPPGAHQYRFVVDGEWLTDPQASETVPNTFGSTNALLKIAQPPHTL